MTTSSIRIAGLYLAAGLSRRMGRQKLLMSVEGCNRKLGMYALLQAGLSGIDDLSIVSRTQLMSLWMEGSSVYYDGGLYQNAKIVDCIVEISDEAAEQGLSQSIRAGMNAALRKEAGAVVILLADQPLVTSTMIDRLISSFLADPGLHYVAYNNGEALTPPMLVSSALFPSLRELSGDKGAREILRNPDYRGLSLKAEHPEHLLDIDNEQDWLAFEALLSANERV
ncbi:nucleotidyltransferase family protein [Paenibacillus sp. strain BS8-2]